MTPEDAASYVEANFDVEVDE